jgi:adenosylmethionine-8-amino-7-oxononanoate aminotransferase
MAPSLLLPELTSPEATIEASAKPFQKVMQNISSEEQPCLLHRSLVERPYNVTRAAGSYLYLEDGRKILDACGGAAVAIIGHGNKEVIRSSIEQMEKVSYVHTLTYTTDSAEDLARCLLSSDGGYSEHGLVRAFFVGSGSEANDAAMKCARQYWFERDQPQRKYYIARRQGYHGNTLGAMSVSSAVKRKIPYHDILLPNVSFVSPADTYHGQNDVETEEAYVERLVTELEGEFLRLGPENVISFM